MAAFNGKFNTTAAGAGRPDTFNGKFNQVNTTAAGAGENVIRPDTFNGVKFNPVNPVAASAGLPDTFNDASEYFIQPDVFTGKFNPVNTTAGGAGGRPAGVCASKHRCRLVCLLVMNACTWGCLIMLIIASAGGFGASEINTQYCFSDGVSEQCNPESKYNFLPVMIQAASGAGIGVSMLVNLVMMCRGDPILAHLSNDCVDSVVDLQTYVAALHYAVPRIVMSIVCFHYETRSRTVTVNNADGSTSLSTESYQEMVVTHSASAEFRYAVCVDVSPTLTVPLLERRIRLDIAPRHTFADPSTAAQFENEYRIFIASNTRDVQQQRSCRCEVPGLKPSQLVRVHASSDTADETSCVLQRKWYLVSALLGLNGLYGVYFANSASEMDYEIVKSISRIG
jgi:hypothetical protein